MPPSVAVRRVRPIEAPFILKGPSGVTVCDRLKGLTARDEVVLKLTGAQLGTLAARDLKLRCSAGTQHDADRWADRKRALTAESSARWAGSITKATHDQWALARRCQLTHIRGLEGGITMLEHRLSMPVGSKAADKAPGGYRSRHEWFVKSRRLGVLRDRLAREEVDRRAGVVHVVRGGKRLARTRHNLEAAGLTEGQWRAKWEAERSFLQADGESGKRYGNETIRVSPEGEVSIRLPAPLGHLANAPHDRYVLAARVAFAHRGQEWADRVVSNRAVAYRIHLRSDRGRWYLTASWRRAAIQSIPIEVACAHGVAAVDANADHLAVWRLDRHGNPVGDPKRFGYDLSGSASHRDAQLRHAITRLLRWAGECGVGAIAIENLDFAREATREKHGRGKRFRQMISGFPTGNLRARLASMAVECNLMIVVVDPAYTSKWGAQHWQKPMRTSRRTTTRHDAASIAIGRRALGYPIRRRTAPPPVHRSDGQGHRAVQASSRTPGREETRRSVPDRAHDARRRAAPESMRATSASRTVRDARSAEQWIQGSRQNAGQERLFMWAPGG